MTSRIWRISDLARLAYSAACRELSDVARARVATHADHHLPAGELLEEALQLRGQADEVLRLAVAYERARHTSWDEIGERLDMRRQSAHERYKDAVDDVLDGIVFPQRDGTDGKPGWWACPDGLDDPDRTARDLDAWERRHRERTDPDRGKRAVSTRLGEPGRHDAIQAIGIVTTLAARIVERTLPNGVSERSAERMLLEAKLRAGDLMAASERGARSHADALAMRTEAFDGLLEWWTVDTRERVGHTARSDREIVITYDGRPVELLALNDDVADAEQRGWWLWSLAAGATLEDPAVSGHEGHEQITAVEAGTAAVIAAARDHVCQHIASDRAKGYGPFDAAGIAGHDVENA